MEETKDKLVKAFEIINEHEMEHSDIIGKKPEGVIAMGEILMSAEEGFSEMKGRKMRVDSIEVQNNINNFSNEDAHFIEKFLSLTEREKGQLDNVIDSLLIARKAQ